MKRNEMKFRGWEENIRALFKLYVNIITVGSDFSRYLSFYKLILTHMAHDINDVWKVDHTNQPKTSTTLFNQ